MLQLQWILFKQILVSPHQRNCGEAAPPVALSIMDTNPEVQCSAEFQENILNNLRDDDVRILIRGEKRFWSMGGCSSTKQVGDPTRKWLPESLPEMK